MRFRKIIFFRKNQKRHQRDQNWRVFMLVPAFEGFHKIPVVSLRFQRDEDPVSGHSGNDLVAVNKWRIPRVWSLFVVWFCFVLFSTDNTDVFLQIIHKTHTSRSEAVQNPL